MFSHIVRNVVGDVQKRPFVTSLPQSEMICSSETVENGAQWYFMSASPFGP